MKIFVASAMEKQHTEGVATLGRLFQLLESRYGEGSTFLAAARFPTPDTYILPRESYDLIVPILNRAHVFILYYPRKVFSGALVELGFALAWGKPTLVLTEATENLPYMFQGGADMMRIEHVTPEHSAEAFLASINLFIQEWAPGIDPGRNIG